MSVTVSLVDKKSPAKHAGIRPGDVLLSINGNTIEDVLDYRFYMIEKKLTVEINRSGKILKKKIKKKDEYEELGLEFETYLMDKQHSCRNKCIFCFIDQLPKGLRPSLYFKDDDSRLSFLFGNYITLTNLSEHEADRIVKMHISPINISVHTTDPELRCRMMKNRFAGESLKYLYRFAESGIKINCQLVLCPGFNDGESLVKTMEDLGALYPSVQSVAAVPVGLSKHREGLEKLEPFNKETAAAVIDAMEKKGDEFLKEHGTRLFFASDEFYLTASRELPGYDFYEDFSQLENGVGMYAMTRHTFYETLEDHPDTDAKAAKKLIVTGRAAKGLLDELVSAAKKRFPQIDCEVFAVRNDLFGERITVAGLVVGGDIINQLSDKTDGRQLIIPSSMLDSEGRVFLDDTSVEDVEKALSTEVFVSDCSAEKLLDILLM